MAGNESLVHARQEALDTIQWVADFRDGQFSPAYYVKAWPVEMDGLAESADRLAKLVLDYEDALRAIAAHSLAEFGLHPDHKLVVNIARQVLGESDRV